jgi:hypothetical protein
LIPIVHASVQGTVHLLRAGADTPGERALAQDLPEALDEVEPGGAFGQGHEVTAWVPQFHNMVSTLQCNGRQSTMRYASPGGKTATARVRF